MLKNHLIDGVLAGCMVSVGGAVLLSCDNRYIGALLFDLKTRQLPEEAYELEEVRYTCP